MQICLYNKGKERGIFNKKLYMLYLDKQRIASLHST